MSLNFVSFHVIVPFFFIAFFHFLSSHVILPSSFRVTSIHFSSRHFTLPYISLKALHSPLNFSSSHFILPFSFYVTSLFPSFSFMSLFPPRHNSLNFSSCQFTLPLIFHHLTSFSPSLFSFFFSFLFTSLFTSLPATLPFILPLFSFPSPTLSSCNCENINCHHPTLPNTKDSSMNNYAPGTQLLEESASSFCVVMLFLDLVGIEAELFVLTHIMQVSGKQDLCESFVAVFIGSFFA